MTRPSYREYDFDEKGGESETGSVFQLFELRSRKEVDLMKKLLILCALFLLAGFARVADAAPLYVEGVTASSNWYDVSQGSYDNMCWAATAANVLAYTEWNGGLGTADQIFAYYTAHWSNNLGNTWPAIRWFFDGVDDTNYGPARVTTPGGNFYSWANFNSNVGAYPQPKDAWTGITDYVNRSHDANPSNDAGIYAFLDGSVDHWVTVWGYDTDGGNKIIITDSFYNTNSLDTYGVSLGIDGLWHLGGIYTGYTIGSVSRLNVNFDEIPPNQTQPVPEPSTLLLLGSGLVGIVAWKRKK